MRKFRVILLLITFAAAAWCTAQVATTNPPTSQPEAAAAGAAGGVVPLTENQREQVLSFLKTEQPDLFKKLADVRQAAPQRYTAMLNQVGRQTLYLIDIQRSNPDLYAFYKEEAKVAREIERLRGQLAGNTDPSHESELVAELREQLSSKFDLVQARQKLLVQQARLTVERTDRSLALREANKQSLIDRELQLLVDAAKGKPGPRTGTPITVDSVMMNTAAPSTPTSRPAEK
ncbi:MAG: hypothetical protein PHU85_09245 [Phycisphaerae bacterium]|nr:hypothetical protein [Phycisphaerae bacterium]